MADGREKQRNTAAYPSQQLLTRTTAIPETVIQVVCRRFSQQQRLSDPCCAWRDLKGNFLPLHHKLFVHGL